MQNFCSTVRIESRTYHDPHILNVYKWTIKAPRWVNYRYWICLTLTLISTTNCKFRKRKRHNLKCSRFAAQVRQRGKVQKKKKAEAQCPFPVHMLQHRSIQRVTLTMMARAVHIMSWTVERVYRAKFLNKPILCPRTIFIWQSKQTSREDKRGHRLMMIWVDGPAGSRQKSCCRFAELAVAKLQQARIPQSSCAWLPSPRLLLQGLALEIWPHLGLRCGCWFAGMYCPWWKFDD